MVLIYLKVQRDITLFNDINFFSFDFSSFNFLYFLSCRELNGNPEILIRKCALPK